MFKRTSFREREAEYVKETALLRGLGGIAHGWVGAAVSAAFKITMIEGIEVVFIVVAMGAAGGGLLVPASLGAIAALLLVVALSLVLHRPVAMIPENTLKFVLGLLLCSFGTFWIGEGIGFVWPGGDLAIAALITGFLTTAIVLVQLCRARAFRVVVSTQAGQ